MIWQILRRDPVLRQAPFWALACAALYPLLGTSRLAAVGYGAVLFPPYLLSLLYTGQRATRFYAALPIPSRHLLGARLVAALGIFWIPSAALAIAMIAKHGVAPPETLKLLVRLSAAWTVAIIALLAARIKELGAPKGLPGVAFFFVWLGFMESTILRFPRIFAVFVVPSLIIAVVNLKWERGTREPLWFVFFAVFMVGLRWAAVHVPALPMVAVCAAAALALLLYLWKAAPPAFQIAPARTSNANARSVPKPAHVRSTAQPARFAWWKPAGDSIFSPHCLIFFPMILLTAGTSTWILGGFYLAALWILTWQRIRWLAVLPIHPRKMLVAVMAPVLILRAAGYYARGLTIKRHPMSIPELQVQIVELATMAAFTLAIMLAASLVTWRRARRISKGVRLAWLLTLIVAGSAGGMLLLFLPSDGPLMFMNAVRTFARWFPSAYHAAALAAAVLATLWLALEKVHREAEFADRPAARQEGPYA